MNKTIHFILTTLVGLSAGCSPDVSTRTPPNLPFSLLTQLTPGTTELYTVDMGSSQSHASFLVHIDLSPDFHTRAVSESGHPAYLKGHIQSLRLFLISATSTPSVGPVSPAGGNVYTLPTTFPSLSRNVLFTNVPAGSYYVAAAAFKTSAGPFNTSTNLTKPGSYTYAEGPVAVSNLGGIGGGPDNGRVVIDAHYQVTGTAQIEIPLLLDDELGAKISASVNLIDNP